MSRPAALPFQSRRRTCCTLWRKSALLGRGSAKSCVSCAKVSQYFILRIVRKVSQYFIPQKQTQVMNEGWATFWHCDPQSPL